MGGSYKQCSECGKRALSIATRCPACGCELLTPVIAPEPPRSLERFVSPPVAAAALAAAAILAVASLGGTTGAPRARASAVTVDSGVTTESAFVTATSWLDTANVAALPAEDGGELRVARTWTSVRQARSKAADLEAVLLPGDTVLADSLRRGWYRVALEREVIGYVHRSTLTALPSPAASASTDTPGVPPKARPRPSPR